ncbi:MAG TPA: NAD(P)/FAD-dependent oxidoreductase [Solirubrobacteraceae bacterium]|nr:NAD(P)/FAD-dependent oxidoreductase [Solirubrobacteraceae bacterium]
MAGPRLFEPYEVAGLRLRNRVVMPPMGTGLPDHDGFVTDETIAYYERRARGGVGMMILEASLVSPDAFGVGPELRLHDRSYVPGLRRLADAVHAHDVPVGVQLWHPGRQTLLGKPIAPSAIPLSSRTPMPHELSLDEIGRLIEYYADSAVNCREAGYDFVEVHGAHCYLPCEFLSPLSNTREDEYGGDLRGRARFMLEIVAAIRAAAGDDFPVFFRISGIEGAEGGIDNEDSAQVSVWLQEAGVACLSVSAGNWYALHYTIPPMSMEPGCLVPFAARIRRDVEIPVMAAGRLDDLATAQRALDDGSADLIGVGRALIADPDWPAKAADGRLDEIRPCIACNACVDLVARAQAARCAVNPEVGRDGSWQLRPAPRARRIMVVGSGPAGMEAARIARLRGHQVSIWEREHELGGKLDVASRAPSKTTVLRFRDYQARILSELGVDIHTGVEVDDDAVRAQMPDVLVVATGADPMIPPIPGIEGPHVVDAQELLLGRATIEPGARVAVIGGSATGCETAEFLIGAAGEISIIEMLPSVGRGVEQITRRRLLSDLRAAGVQILTNSKVIMIEPNRVVYESPDGERGEVAVDRVALAIGWKPRGAVLVSKLPEHETMMLGDAHQAADFVAAVNSGADAGLEV